MTFPFDTLLKSKGFSSLQEALKNNRSVVLDNLWDSPKALIAAIAQQQTKKHILFLTGKSFEETKVFHDFPYFTSSPIYDFPSWETLPTEDVAPALDIVGDRFDILLKIQQLKKPCVIISSLQAALQKLIPKEDFNRYLITLKVGQDHSFEHLIQKLIKAGYKRCPVVTDKGEFAVRGGIIDVFPIALPDPYRIDFFGDEIESIRSFDPIGQKSIEQKDCVTITAADEKTLINSFKNLSSIFDYLNHEVIVIFDDLLSIENRFANLLKSIERKTHSLFSFDEFFSLIKKYQKIYFSDLSLEKLCQVSLLKNDRNKEKLIYPVSFEMFNSEIKALKWENPFLTPFEALHLNQECHANEILEKFTDQSLNALHLHLICQSDTEEKGLKDKIRNLGISLAKNTFFERGYLSSGFGFTDIPHLFIPYAALTKKYKIHRQKHRSSFHTPSHEAYKLTPGDIVVHLNSGIGKFIGIEKRPDHTGTLIEFFVIEYDKGSKMFVPISQSHLITKYIGAKEEVPKLHTLGSNQWKKAKERTQKAILGYASDLLRIYAERDIKGGFVYKEDSFETKAFEEEFPYEETFDQINAIKKIKEDMTSSKAMDRLVCGDVGYGKTEVAMRTAFKAVFDGGKQVAVLVPTTVLAMQHYETFCDRMSDFPINIAVLSRFQTPKQTKRIIEEVEKGVIDILIGTHKIISGNIHFKDLGLVIIDEEQRFGVKAKEFLKKVRSNVDCLTLSATPIPRTLYMSLVGVRDLSLINTPPQDRLPIKTIIKEPSDKVIKQALLRELARDGQAYVIHNRVETIYDVSDRIRKLVPQAKVAVAHGQMTTHEIDSVFHLFKNGKIDVLVATTIVESGIDIPNANTIIIDQAHRFGLADLYQLRGRVGRWNKQAYAYFLVPKWNALPEIARRRLNALAETSGYGGGMKLAMRDLEIRGAGDILGTEQSGHVASIGFHLYCKLLQRTIKTLQGKIPKGLVDTKMEFPFNAHLPDHYINETSLRMEIYQRLAEAITLDDVEKIWEEVKDRFGAPPLPVKWLYQLARLRLWASKRGITFLKLDKRGKLLVEMQQGKRKIRETLHISIPKSPQELEGNVINALKKAGFK